MSRWVGGLVVLMFLIIGTGACSKYQQPAAYPDEKKCNFDKSTTGMGEILGIVGGITTGIGGAAYVVSASQPGAEGATTTSLTAGASGKSVALATSLIGLGVGVLGVAILATGSHDYVADGCAIPRSGGAPPPEPEKDKDGKESK